MVGNIVLVIMCVGQPACANTAHCNSRGKNVLIIKVGVITLKKAQEVEIDGIFNIKNFSPTAFDPEEITILYKSFNDNNMKLVLYLIKLF